MKEKLKAIEVNLQTVLRKVDALEISQPDYQVIAKLGKVELKIDKVFDLLREVEGLADDDV